jgi:HEXXH motif-containing protein
METLITTVILAKGTAVNPAQAVEFESVTALRAFSGVLFNAHSEASRLQSAVSLVHEAAHMALFAYSPKEGVVTNSPTERYVSPLRTDPRPLEGIFHQSFVLARMMYGLGLLRESTDASAEESDFASNFINCSVPRFNDAVETLNRHARLTPQGAKALEASKHFVNSLG